MSPYPCSFLVDLNREIHAVIIEMDDNIIVLLYAGGFVDDELSMFNHSRVCHVPVLLNYSLGVITVITGFSFPTSYGRQAFRSRRRASREIYASLWSANILEVVRL